MREPIALSATLVHQEIDGTIMVVCTFDDGQKYAAIEVEDCLPELARDICAFINLRGAMAKRK